MTLFPFLELRLSQSPGKGFWRALRSTRSLVARGLRGSYRGVITSRAAATGPGDSELTAVVAPGVSPCLQVLSVRIWRKYLWQSAKYSIGECVQMFCCLQTQQM